MKLLRFRKICEDMPAGFDGQRYRVRFDIGSREDGAFRPESTHEFDVEVSGTLQAVWSKSDVRLEQSVATLATSYVLTLASEGPLGAIETLKLNTYTAPKEPPSEPAVAPGATFPIHLPSEDRSMTKGISFLSEDISLIRDQINALTANLWGGRLLRLSQERPLIDMYKSAKTPEEFKSRVDSLANISKDLDDELLERITDTKRNDNTGSFILLSYALASLSDKLQANEIVDVLKNINYLRQGYPTHIDSAKKYLPAHVFFGLSYPIRDFESAWERVLVKYLDSMKTMLRLLSQAWESKN